MSLAFSSLFMFEAASAAAGGSNPLAEHERSATFADMNPKVTGEQVSMK
jgi:hypothetical protein